MCICHNGNKKTKIDCVWRILCVLILISFFFCGKTTTANELKKKSIQIEFTCLSVAFLFYFFFCVISNSNYIRLWIGILSKRSLSTTPKTQAKRDRKLNKKKTNFKLYQLANFKCKKKKRKHKYMWPHNSTLFIGNCLHGQLYRHIDKVIHFYACWQRCKLHGTVHTAQSTPKWTNRRNFSQRKKNNSEIEIGIKPI